MARTQMETTGKVFKVIMAVGVVLAIYGVVSFVANKDTNTGSGLMPIFFGFLIFLSGKILAWWKHG